MIWLVAQSIKDGQSLTHNAFANNDREDLYLIIFPCYNLRTRTKIIASLVFAYVKLVCK